MLVKDIVAGKKYITKNGEEKTRWTTVGQLFIKDDGKMTVKFAEYINPMAFCNDKGEVWFNVFDKKDKDSKEGKTAADEEPGPAAKTEQMSEQVKEEGRKYAEQWKNQAEGQKQPKEHDLEEIGVALSAADEQWFKENSEDIPF